MVRDIDEARKLFVELESFSKRQDASEIARRNFEIQRRLCEIRN